MASFRAAMEVEGKIPSWVEKKVSELEHFRLEHIRL